MDYKEAGETASKLLAYAKDMGLPEEIRDEIHAAAIMLFGVEEALRAAEAAEVRAEKAERERDAAIDDLTFAVNKYRLFTTDIDLCGLCKFDLPLAGESGQTAECPGFYRDNCFEWRGQKEE